MPYTLDEFCRECREALAADPGPGGRESIRRHLEKLLGNAEFVAATLGPDAEPGAHTLYRDPEFDFVVLAHINEAAHKSPPHDHGASWAVYGQATEYTDMTEYRRTDGGAGAGAASLEKLRSYRLTPGKAGRYDVGDIHAIDYPAKARFLRVTGTDLGQVERLKYDTAAGKAEVIENASAG
jgi:hypothetical protein